MLLELVPDMRPTVLVVEDDTATREALVRVLQSERCIVDVASDGEKAIGRLAQKSYDAIVLDIALPKLSGTDVMEYIASTRPRMLESIVVVTCFSRMRNVPRTVDLVVSGSPMPSWPVVTSVANTGLLPS